MELIIFTDGGARGNPGPSSAAFVVTHNQQIIYETATYLGTNTNNVAEYRGLISALEWLTTTDIGITTVTICMDSLLIVNQINGLYKVKEPKLQTLFHSAKLLIKDLSARTEIFTTVHVPRSQNTRADFLVNQCLDKSARESLS